MKYQWKILSILLLVFMVGAELSAAEFRIGLRAKSGIDYAHAQWQVTVDLLNEAIPKHHFTLMPIVKLNEVTAAAGRGEFEFVHTNPSSYAMIRILLYGCATV